MEGNIYLSVLGIVFITFESLNMSKEVYDSFQSGFLQFSYKPPASSKSAILKPEDWKVNFAPTPDDIYWENLCVERR